MTYIDMVRNAPEKSEEIMWQSVEAVSDLVEKLKVSHPEMAREFLMKEHSRMYGPHFNEEMAKEVVAQMYHYNSAGEKIKGEAVTVQDAERILGGIDNAQDKRWDAYVGVNGFMHDMAKSDLSSRAIMELAKMFWFEDEAFQGKSKVFWYYSSI